MMIKRMFTTITLLLGVLCLLIPEISIGQNPRDIVALWLFNERQGDILKELSGKGHHGTITGAQWVPGKFGGGLQFNGANSKVTVPYASDLALERFTIEVWVKVQPTNYYQAILSRGYEPTRNYELGLGTHQGGGALFSNMTTNNGTTWGGATGKTDVADDKWHHVAATYDGQAVKIYVDGNLDAMRLFRGTPDKKADQPMVVIGSTNGSKPAKTEWLKGKLDELALWQVALSQGEIQGTMVGLQAFAVSPLGKLAALWGAIKWTQ